MRPSAHDRAHELLHQMVGPDASFRDGQLDAIVASVDERARTLIKTGRPRGPPRRTRIWPRRHPRCTREGFAGVLVRAIAIVTRDPNIMIQPIDLPLAALAPSPLLFTHQSPLHGQSHVSRVLVHAFRLVEATGWIEEAPRLWAAVYLHDLARPRRHLPPARRRRHEEVRHAARRAHVVRPRWRQERRITRTSIPPSSIIAP